MASMDPSHDHVRVVEEELNRTFHRCHLFLVEQDRISRRIEATLIAKRHSKTLSWLGEEIQESLQAYLFHYRYS